MFDDRDMKIAGSKPSESIKRNNAEDTALTLEKIAAAKNLGKNIGVKFCESVNTAFVDDTTDSQMLIQRQFLLSFTVSVTLDELCFDDSAAGIAEKSFLDYLKGHAPQIYATCSDTGAFSFYYLAYRRKIEVERRIGQTFAMLCAHDGDPIYQELGEVLYCWFRSVVQKEIEKCDLAK
jgi:hypothetical protein